MLFSMYECLSSNKFVLNPGVVSMLGRFGLQSMRHRECYVQISPSRATPISEIGLAGYPVPSPRQKSARLGRRSAKDG
jgi:hypothetical protein